MKSKWLRKIVVGLVRKVTALPLRACSWLAVRPVWERRLNLLGLCWAVPELAQKIWAISDDTFNAVLFWIGVLVLVVLPFVARRQRNPMFAAIFSPAKRSRAATWPAYERQSRQTRMAADHARWQPEESAFDRFERSISDGVFEMETLRVDSPPPETPSEQYVWRSERTDWPHEDPIVNPAGGLLMVGGIGGLDLDGNPFGADFDHHHHDIGGNSGFSSSIDWD